MEPIIYSISDFRKEMTPDIYKEGVARIEHADNRTGQMRMWPTMSLSSSVAYGSDIEDNKLSAFTSSGTTIYALGFDSSASNPAIFKWNAASLYWEGHATFGAGSTAEGIILYQGILFGLYNGTNIYRVTLAGTPTPTHKTLSYTNYAHPIVHSKDNVAYFFTDNIVSSFGKDANGALESPPATVTTALTLPTNFRITAACEDGDYIFIVGYDTDQKATGYLWNRDSSLATTTAKYDLGYEIPYHCGRIGAYTFIVSASAESTNSAVTDTRSLTIRRRNGDMAEIMSEYQMTTLILTYQGRYTNNNKMYFSAHVKMKNDTAAKNVIFRLDQDGRLTMALNMGVNAAVNDNETSGIFREGDGWWIAGRTKGSWHGVNSYTTVAAFESSVIRSKNKAHNLQFLGAIIECESLSSVGRIVLKARKDLTAAFTTLATFTTASATKFALSQAVSQNALELSKAKHAQFRIEIDNTGAGTTPVVITGFQALFKSIADENHG